MVVTSAGASEGKTTASVNIAAALAEDGSRVLLIDADLRHPSVAHKIDIDGSAGLTHVLSGQAAVKDVIQRYWKPNLHIIPAGPKPPNASTLLNSPLMTTLVANAMQQYDYIIIDTAPMVVANLHIIPAGPKPPNASTLLNSPLMTTLVANAMQQYDYIIIDTAPMVVA